MRFLQICCLAVIACVSQARAADFFFKDGDRVVMIGDSITEQHLYSNFVEMWTVTRFPKWKLTFRNVGIGGDTSGGGNGRFARDVLSYHPTAMTVDFGMNDGRYRAFDQGIFDIYMKGLQGMADQAKAAKVRVAWVTPQPLDAGDQGPTALVGYNQTLEKYSEGVQKIAEGNGGLFVDQFHPYLSVLDRARQAGPKYDRITGGDAVHPGPPGQTLMAASILKGLNFPKLVSSAELDATGKVVSAENCTIDKASASNGGLRFTRLDGALPFYPMDAQDILRWAPMLEEMNEYRLKVTGLPAGKYEVRIGGAKVASATAEELAKGTNLAASALASGPIADQVNRVRQAVEQKNRYHHDEIFRGIVLNVPGWVYEAFPREEVEAKKDALIQKRLKHVEELDAVVADALKLQPLEFEVVPVK